MPHAVLNSLLYAPPIDYAKPLPTATTSIMMHRRSLAALRTLLPANKRLMMASSPRMSAAACISTSSTPQAGNQVFDPYVLVCLPPLRNSFSSHPSGTFTLANRDVSSHVKRSQLPRHIINTWSPFIHSHLIAVPISKIQDSLTDDG